jgi:hypothetical protein
MMWRMGAAASLVVPLAHLAMAGAALRPLVQSPAVAHEKPGD